MSQDCTRVVCQKRNRQIASKKAGVGLNAFDLESDRRVPDGEVKSPLSGSREEVVQGFGQLVLIHKLMGGYY